MKIKTQTTTSLMFYLLDFKLTHVLAYKSKTRSHTHTKNLYYDKKWLERRTFFHFFFFFFFQVQKKNKEFFNNNNLCNCDLRSSLIKKKKRSYLFLFLITYNIKLECGRKEINIIFSFTVY